MNLITIFENSINKINIGVKNNLLLISRELMNESKSFTKMCKAFLSNASDIIDGSELKLTYEFKGHVRSSRSKNPAKFCLWNAVS